MESHDCLRYQETRHIEDDPGVTKKCTVKEKCRISIHFSFFESTDQRETILRKQNLPCVKNKITMITIRNF